MQDQLKKNSKILIVDDISQNIQVLGGLLSKESYELAVAQNGLQAISTAKQFLPDLILMDVTMPEMDGLEATKIIRNDEDLKNIPVIFITARDAQEDMIAGFKAGGVDYVTKPFNAAELLQRVETHLELKKSRDIIEKQNQELEALNKSKDKFFSIVSHDLRGPFAGSLGMSELILARPDDFTKDELINIIDKIFVSQKNQLQLIENLLDWSRIQTGRIENKPIELNLYTIVNNIINVLNQSAYNKHINLTNNVGFELTVVADEFMISTIIRNLISNAIKFTPENGSIEVNCEILKNKIQLIVKDNGLGMTEEEMSKLFKIENHFTTLGTKRERGTGLGLILCKEFAEANNANLFVNSSKGNGSAFTLEFNL